MKNTKIISLITIAFILSLALTSAYTPLLSTSYNKDNNQNQQNNYVGISALACDVGYYGFNCHNSVNSNSKTYNYNYDNRYDYTYYNNYIQDNNYRTYNQAGKLYYPNVYNVKQYKIYNSNHQERYIRTVNRCSTRDYTYPCDFYY